MFLILPIDRLSVADCGLGTHRVGDQNCVRTKINISSFTEDYLINGFFVLLYRRLRQESMQVITYYRTKADPDDHYKYTQEMQLKAYGTYRARIENYIACNQQVINYGTLMDLSIIPDMVITPYNFYFGTYFSRFEFADKYNDFTERIAIQILYFLDSEELCYTTDQKSSSMLFTSNGVDNEKLGEGKKKDQKTKKT